MLKKLLSLLSDIAVYGASSLLSQVIGFVLLPLYTRYLTPADQGYVTMVLTVTSFFMPLGNLGMVNAIFRRFNLEKDPAQRGHVLSTGLFSVLTSSLVVLAIVEIFAPQISRLSVGDISATSLVRLALVTAAINTVGMVPLAVLRADRLVKTTAVINITKLLVTVLSTIYLVVGREQGVWGVVLGTFIGEATLGCVQFAITSRSFRYGVSYEMWRRLSAYGLPMVPHQIQSMLLMLLGQYAVGSMLGLEEAGFFNIASKFTMPIVFVVNAVQNAWTAFKFQIHADDDDPAGFFRTAFTYWTAGICYLWVGVSLWGPEALWIMTDPSYYPAAGLIALLGLMPVSRGIQGMMGTGMEMSDDTRPFPFISLIGLITAVASIYLLIEPFGAAGAAAGSSLASLVMAVIFYHFSQQRFRIHYDWPTLTFLFVLSIVATTLGHFGLNLPATQRLTLSVAISLVFPILEFLVLLRSSTERHRMQILRAKFAKMRSGKPARRKSPEPVEAPRAAQLENH